MTYTDGYLRSGSSSYPGGRYTSSGRSCGSPRGLPRSNSLLMTCSSMRPARSADQGSTALLPDDGFLAYEVTEDGGGDRARGLVGSQVGCATDDGQPGAGDAEGGPRPLPGRRGRVLRARQDQRRRLDRAERGRQVQAGDGRRATRVAPRIGAEQHVQDRRDGRGLARDEVRGEPA